MEHLGEGIVHCVPRVPYIVQEGEQYDGKGFLEFPVRCGWNLGKNGKFSVPPKSKFRPGPLGSLAGLLQAWLFFGLLSEVLGSKQVVVLQHFITIDEHGKQYLTTEKLPGYLEQWKNSVDKDTSRNFATLIRIHVALKKAHDLVSRFCSVKPRNESSTWPVDERISLSFMVLGETLTHAYNMIVKATSIHSHDMNGFNLGSWGESAVINRRFTEEGWCPYTVHTLTGIIGQRNSGLLLALSVSHPKALALKHDRCSRNECIARKSENFGGRCFKLGGDCTCEHIGPKVGEVLAVLRKGKIPLLQYDSGRQVLEVVEYRSGLKYFIISHVCTDGFGSDTNSMSLCRIKYLLGIFGKVTTTESAWWYDNISSQLHTPYLFWIDTLAIPFEKAHRLERRVAIRSMDEFYQNATCAIVLDAGIMEQEIGRTFASTAMRIMTSTWITRLWTLQEAFLSRRLLFKFKDGIIGIDELERMDKMTVVSPLPSIAQLYLKCLLGHQKSFIWGEDAGTINGNLIGSIWKALQSRTTTHAQHEPLAIAILLRLPTASLDESIDIEPATRVGNRDNHDRMVKLLNLCSNQTFPAGMAFLGGPKVDVQGYGWAPLSWMQTQGRTRVEAMNAPSFDAMITSEGLRFRSAGFMIHPLCAQSEILHGSTLVLTLIEAAFDKITIEAIDTVGPEYCYPSDANLAIVLQQERPEDAQQVALLVIIYKTMDNTLYSSIIKRVWVSIGQRNSETDQLDAFPSTSDTIYAIPTKQVRRWCLDGPRRFLSTSKHDSSSRGAFAWSDIRKWAWKEPQIWAEEEALDGG